MAEAELAGAAAQSSSTDVLIAYFKLQIEKLRRELFGQRSEHKVRLLDQLELEELEATGGELAARQAASKTISLK